MSSELMRSPSMSKMQARIVGKLIAVFVIFGVYGTALLSTTSNAHLKSIHIYFCMKALTLSQGQP